MIKPDKLEQILAQVFADLNYKNLRTAETVLQLQVQAGILCGEAGGAGFYLPETWTLTSYRVRLGVSFKYESGD